MFGKGHMNGDDSNFSELLPQNLSQLLVIMGSTIHSIPCGHLHNYIYFYVLKPKASDSILSDKPQTRINRSLNSKHRTTADTEALSRMKLEYK